MKQKLILFDWGNIVESHSTGYSCSDAWNDLFAACGYKGNKNIFNELGKYKLTAISNMADFEKTYNEISKDFNFNTTYSEFIKLYKEKFDKIDYYKDVAEYEKSLKDRCYIGIFSNLTLLDKERLNKQVDLSKYDYAFLSFELGMKKPNIEIYEKVQSIASFKSEDILFIDDRTNNIETAYKLGWNVFQATGLELDKIKEVCEEFINRE